MHITTLRLPVGILLAALLLVAGCTSQPATTSPPVTRGPSPEGERYVLSTEPSDAQDVIPTRSSVEDGEEVVVIGRIGGGSSPFVDGRAAFSIVDRSLQACSDIPGDKCPTPWDYCCRTDALPQATVLVKVVDESGTLIPVGAQELLGLDHLQTVVVQGKAQRDEAGNVTILASALHVRDDGGKGHVPPDGGHDETQDHSHHDGHHHDRDEPHSVENDDAN